MRSWYKSLSVIPLFDKLTKINNYSSFLFQEETTEEEKETLDFDDIEMHEDDDFLKTLETLDEGRPPKKVLSYYEKKV